MSGRLVRFCIGVVVLPFLIWEIFADWMASA